MPAKRALSTAEAQSSRKKSKRPIVISSDNEPDEATYPTPDQTTIQDGDSDGDSDDDGVVSTVKTRAARAQGATTAGAKATTKRTGRPRKTKDDFIVDDTVVDEDEPAAKATAKRTGRPRKTKDDFIVDDTVVDEDEPAAKATAKRTGRPRKTKDDFIVDDDEPIKTTKRKRKKADSDEEGDEDENPLEGYGQKKHVLEWLHMSFRLASVSKAQVNVTETLKSESARAHINSQRKLEKDKLAILDRQIRLTELENERMTSMTPAEREAYGQAALEELRKEVEQLKVRCANKESDVIKIQKELTEAQINLEKEKGNRMAMEARLIRAGLSRDEEAYTTGS